MAERRKGGIPPIVTVLITISAIVAASVVAWFMYASTRSATQAPMLEVTEAYAVGKTLYVNVRNLGPLNITGISAPSSKLLAACSSGAIYDWSQSASLAITPTVSQQSQLAPGMSVALSIPMTGTVGDGESCTITLQVSTSSGSHVITVGFKVTKP